MVFLVIMSQKEDIADLSAPSAMWASGVRRQPLVTLCSPRVIRGKYYIWTDKTTLKLLLVQ